MEDFFIPRCTSPFLQISPMSVRSLFDSANHRTCQLVLFQFYIDELNHDNVSPANLCKFGNYLSGLLDADSMDVMRGLKRKKNAGGWGA